MASKWRGLAMAAALSVGTTGCLLKDRTDTWYLDPGGAVTWSVTEKDVRSDARAAVDRQNEEGNYITAVRNQQHPIARGLALLGPIDVHTRILRAAVPYTVVTDGRFASIDVLGRWMIVRLGLAGTSVLERTADGTTWTFSVRDPHAEGAAHENDDSLSALMDGLDDLKVVLVTGEFLAADGFELSGDGRVAAYKKDDETAKRDGDAVIVLRLRWK